MGGRRERRRGAGGRWGSGYRGGGGGGVVVVVVEGEGEVEDRGVGEEKARELKVVIRCSIKGRGRELREEIHINGNNRDSKNNKFPLIPLQHAHLYIQRHEEEEMQRVEHSPNS